MRKKNRGGKEVEFKGQRKIIMQHLAKQSGWKGIDAIRKDIKSETRTDIPAKSFKTVCAILKKEGHVNQDGELQSWSITTKGMEELQKGETKDQEPAIEASSEQGSEEDEEGEAEGEGEVSQAQEHSQEPVIEPKSEEEKKALDVLSKANELLTSAIEAATKAAASAEKAKRIADGFIPGQHGSTVIIREPSQSASTQEPAQAPVEREREAARSREDLGLTPYQFFQRIGRDIGGLTHEKVRTVADVVFGDDYESIDRVHANLGGMNVAPDLAKAWALRWQTYLKAGSGKVKISDDLQQSLTPTLREQAEQAGIKPGDDNYDWDVFKTPDGLYHSENVGPGGRFTKDGAARELNGIIRQLGMSAAQAAPAGQPEPISKLLEAIKPYVQPEKGEESKATEQTILKWLIDTKLGEMEKAVTGSQANQGGMTMEKFMNNLPAYAETLKVVGPIIKGALGIQDTPPQAPPQQPQTSIAMMDQHGNPISMNLGDLITFKKFEAEEKREDESAKGKETTLKSVRGFMDALAKAAVMAANQGGQ